MVKESVGFAGFVVVLSSGLVSPGGEKKIFGNGVLIDLPLYFQLFK